MKKCPKCKLINPDSALRCDCGYDFRSGTQKESLLTFSQQAQANKEADTLTGIDLALSILVPLYGVIVGTIRVAKGKSSGYQMIGLSLAALTIAVFIRLFSY